MRSIILVHTYIVTYVTYVSYVHTNLSKLQNIEMKDFGCKALMRFIASVSAATSGCSIQSNIRRDYHNIVFSYLLLSQIITISL